MYFINVRSIVLGDLLLQIVCKSPQEDLSLPCLYTYFFSDY